jgi:hypothetical protein
MTQWLSLWRESEREMRGTSHHFCNLTFYSLYCVNVSCQNNLSSTVEFLTTTELYKTACASWESTELQNSMRHENQLNYVQNREQHASWESNELQIAHHENRMNFKTACVMRIEWTSNSTSWESNELQNSMRHENQLNYKTACVMGIDWTSNIAFLELDSIECRQHLIEYYFLHSEFRF